MNHTAKSYREPHDLSHCRGHWGFRRSPCRRGLQGLRRLPPHHGRRAVVRPFASGLCPHAVSWPEDPLSELSGLDMPSPRYLAWVGHMSSGDFGYSLRSGTAVRDEVFERLPSTLSLLPLTLFLAAAVSIPLGVLAAVRRGSLIDRVAGGAAVFGVGVPGFWLALMLILVLRTWSRDGPMNELVLPSLVLAVLAGAVMVRIIRSSVAGSPGQCGDRASARRWTARWGVPRPLPRQLPDLGSGPIRGLPGRRNRGRDSVRCARHRPACCQRRLRP